MTKEVIADLIKLIDTLHATPDTEHDCIGFAEGQSCCLDRIRNSQEYEKLKKYVESEG